MKEGGGGGGLHERFGKWGGGKTGEEGDGEAMGVVWCMARCVYAHHHMAT